MLDVLVGRFAQSPFRRQIPKPPRHLPERFVCLEETPRLGIDQRNAARHVGQDLVVEDNFALDPCRRFSLPPVKLSGQPGNDSPSRRSASVASTVILSSRSRDWLIGDGAWLLDHRDPAGRLNGRGGIEFSSLLDVSAFVGADVVNERLRGVGNRAPDSP